MVMGATKTRHQNFIYCNPGDGDVCSYGVGYSVRSTKSLRTRMQDKFCPCPSSTSIQNGGNLWRRLASPCRSLDVGNNASTRRDWTTPPSETRLSSSLVVPLAKFDPTRPRRSACRAAGKKAGHCTALTVRRPRETSSLFSTVWPTSLSSPRHQYASVGTVVARMKVSVRCQRLRCATHVCSHSCM